MPYTKQERKDLHTAFKAAVPHLTESKYLCIALQTAYNFGLIREDQYLLAINEISKRLGSQAIVYFWLVRTAGIPQNKITPELLKDYRKRWLQSLIKEFSK